MKVTPGEVLRCPKDCPERKPGCHNTETCECWSAQEEDRKQKRESRWGYRLYPHSWAQRGLYDREGKLKK